MSEIVDLRRARGYAKAKLTKLRTRLTQASDQSGLELDKEQAEARLEKLEEAYNEFESIQKQLIEKEGEFTDEDALEQEYFEERYFEQMRRDAQHEGADAMTPRSNNEALSAILARQTDILDRVANNASMTGLDTRVKLPTIKLPKFDGKIEDWKAFSESFRSIIHVRTQLSDVEKFQYLISSISGDAAKIIESIELTGQNYSTAWELLLNRYDDPRSLKKKHIECLFTMPVVTKESVKALRELIDYTSRHLRMLKILGLPTDTWDDLIMHMMEDKFDVKTLRAWEEETKSSETVTLNDMLEFLKNRSLILERIESRSVNKAERSCKEKEQRSKGSHGHSKSQFANKGAANQKTSSLTASLNSGKYAYHKVKRRQILMATARLEATRCNGTRFPIRVLLDSASEANFITQAACNKLGLKGSRAFETVIGLNEIENRIHSVCEVHVLSKYSNFEVNVQCLIVPKITKNLPSMRIDRDKLPIPGNIVLADPEFHNNGPIDMLLGAEYFFDMIVAGKIELGQDQLILQNTKLGWIIAGSVPLTACRDSINDKGTSSALVCSLESCDGLKECLERFWKLEDYGSNKTKVLSIDEKRCEQHFEQTVTLTGDGRFMVRLPMRDANLPIGDNREIALKRLMHLERTLKNNEVMRDRYVKFMREYIELDHMTVLKPSFDDCKGAVYLPHHGVLKESSSSTKLRVVFDASAKNNKGVSLNDALLIGPVLQDSLIDIIIRFRTYKIALTADLQKMYRQVLVQEDDRDFQRVLWRFSPDEPVQDYRLNTVT
ncbi:hypothetical protein ALC57_18716 [Trachymyrmex cornetzi]|uniref:Uncharacterized protein n=1 Tax=Trachymyrmex cornetzi TaxID=471704 RepID=A0A151IR94_9HYME|nr:hypothetical protein ALC57_18716 [Trachymyrmex cornetzi]